MPTGRLGTEKESSPVDQLGTDTNGHERHQESRQSMATLPDRSASNAGIRSRLKFNRKRTDDSDQKKKQLQDYTAWVNNYLKRKPGVPLIKDIRASLQDGISFVNLVEIVSRAEVEGVERYPTNADSRRNNIERAVRFLREDGVTLHGEAVRDILDGNSKGVMRVVLAIAERYQPRSVKPRSASDPKPYTVVQPSTSYLRDHETPNRPIFGGHVTNDSNQHRDHVTRVRVQSPDIAPSNGKRSTLASNSFSVPNMNSLNTQAGGGSHRNLSQSFSNPNATGYGPPQHNEHSGLSQPDRPFQTQEKHSVENTRAYSLTQADMENDMYSMPVDHLPPNATTRIIAPLKKMGVQLRLRSGSTAIHSIPEDREFADKGGVLRRSSMGGASAVVSGAISQTDSGAMFTEISDVLSGLNQFKTELLELHAAVLKNTDGSETSLIKDSKMGGAPNSKATPTSCNDVPLEINTTAMLAEKEHILAQKEVEVSSMRDQLAQLQDEYTQVESECSALRNMVEERNTFITTMKSEIYRKEYKNDTAKVDLHNQLLQKDNVIKKLEGEVMSCKDSLERHQSNLEETNLRLEEHKNIELELTVEVDALKADLAKVGLTEDALQSKLVSKERKIGHLEEKVADLQDSRTRKIEAISEDAEGIRECFVSLRRTLAPQDPQQQTVDNLERTISELVSKLMERSSSPTGKRSRRHGHRGDVDDHHRDKDRERRRRHREKHILHSEPKAEVGGGSFLPTPIAASAPGASPTGSGDVTKVFYYIINDKTETPYVTLVPRKSDEVTLREFKAVFDRQGHFRFFVKTEDPDCGVVKEEIVKEDTPLPSWKGKILVWVSEKSHHR